MDTRIEKISDAETEIMKVIWSSQEPITYAGIRTALTKQTGWESPTINTLVNRLVKKGVLIQKKKDVYYYKAAISEEEYMEAKTQSFVKKVYGGNIKGLMSALLNCNDLTQDDLEELRMQWKKGGK